MQVENDVIRVAFDATCGALLSVFHKSSQLELISCSQDDGPQPPWALYLDGEQEPIIDFETFDVAHEADQQDHALSMTWLLADGIRIVARALLPANDAPLELWIRVENPTPRQIVGLTFPVIRGIGPLSARGENDYLMHPVVTGMLFQNPHALFDADRPGLVNVTYPSGEGASMQFMAYYADGIGGFYFASHDPFMTAKEIDFYRDPGERGLTARFKHFNWDLEPRKGMDLGYPVLIAPLIYGDWFEAAHRYRRWAADQEWVSDGPVAQSPDKASSRWLYEDVGLCTFGTKGNEADPEGYAALSEQLQVPIFHVLYGRPIPDSGNLQRENLDAIKKCGSHFATFENDIIIPVASPDFDSTWAISPYKEARWGSWRAAWMDPTTEFVRERQAKRARGLVQAYGPDAFYYDISTSFAPMGCLDPAHGHPLGSGRWMIRAYWEFYQFVREAARQAATEVEAGETNLEFSLPRIPMGTEGIHEAALKVIDFYQARAWSYPACYDFEGREFMDWIKAGRVQLIPAFTYVYHQYGGLRMDGWGQLSDEEGDYAYAIAARCYLWGGLYQLNYEFDRFTTPPSDAKLQFLRSLADARLTFARPFWVNGKMMPFPRVTPSTGPESVSFDYYVTNLPFGIPKRSGTHMDDAIVTSAWQGPSGDLAFFFVDLAGLDREVSFPFDPLRYGWAPNVEYGIERYESDGWQLIGEQRGRSLLKVALPQRRLTALRLRCISR